MFTKQDALEAIMQINGDEVVNHKHNADQIDYDDSVAGYGFNNVKDVLDNIMNRLKAGGLMLDTSNLTLPATGNDNTIYVVPTSNPNPQSRQTKDWFMWINGTWEQIDIPMENYYTKGEVDTMMKATSQTIGVRLFDERMSAMPNGINVTCQVYVKDAVTGVLIADGTPQVQTWNGSTLNFTIDTNKYYEITFDSVPNKATPYPLKGIANKGYDLRDIIYDDIWNIGLSYDKTDSDSSSCLTYIGGCTGFTPLTVDTNGNVSWGSWNNHPLIRKIKPCMLETNGEVKYYLDKNDQTLKADGTASEISDSTQTSNAMVEIPTIWVKIVPTANGFDVYLSNVQIDDTYKAYAHTNSNDEIQQFLYVGMFEVANISSKSRSLASGFARRETSFNAIRTDINAIGRGWDMKSYSQHMLLTWMSLFLIKDFNYTLKYGKGYYKGVVGKTLGDTKNKGMFYGTQANNTTFVKILFMENFYGNQWEFVVGFGSKSTKQYAYKLTPPYNTNMSNYNLSTPYTVTTTGGFLNTLILDNDIVTPDALGGSATTGICANIWRDAVNAYGSFGGSWKGTALLTPFSNANFSMSTTSYPDNYASRMIYLSED